jgi:hypothetical protein
MCRLSRNQGASTSWKPKGLSRPVMGLLLSPRRCNYIYIYNTKIYHVYFVNMVKIVTWYHVTLHSDHYGIILANDWTSCLDYRWILSWLEERWLGFKEGHSFVELGIQRTGKLVRSLCKAWRFSKGSFPTLWGFIFDEIPNKIISVGAYDVYANFLKVWLKRDRFLGNEETQWHRERQTSYLTLRWLPKPCTEDCIKFRCSRMNRSACRVVSDAAK